MVHKRSLEKQLERERTFEFHRQRRAYYLFMWQCSWSDWIRGESVNRLDESRALDFLGQLFHGVLPGVVNKEVGEVLCDSRGNGSMQTKHVKEVASE